MAAGNWTSIQQSCIVALSQAPAPYNVLPADFETVQFPQAMSYAEDRIYRDMVPLCTRRGDDTLTTTPNISYLDLNALTTKMLVVEQFALITPAGAVTPEAGTLVFFDGASRAFVNMVLPTRSFTMNPALADNVGRYWSMIDDHTVFMSPTPDASYTVLVVGLFQPTPISPTNPTTYLSTFYPELLISCGLIFLSGALLRNFGQMADDPKMALSWEKDYHDQLAGALAEEARRRQLGIGWQPQPNAEGKQAA